MSKDKDIINGVFIMFELDECIAFITNNTSKKLASAFNDRTMKDGISRVQWITLYYLWKHETLSQIELCNKMNKKQSTIVRLIDRMVRDGLVIRKKDSKDRRITNVMLTEKGKELREKVFSIGDEMSEIFTKGITEKELKVFTNVLNKMQDNIK